MPLKYFLLIINLITLSTLSAQVQIPPLSQRQIISQTVGFTEVTIEYCRPHMRGREIFGGLEKYGEVWRTGANRNTQITFGESVTVGETTLPKGTYTLFTRPNISSWDIYFYPYDNGYGVPQNFHADSSEATITAAVFTLNRDIQNLTITLENVKANTADLIIMWERTYVAVPITFTTEEKILNDISELVNNHSGDYYTAAKYYLDTGKDLEKAKVFIQQAIDMREAPEGTPKFWIYQLQAEILLANGEKEAARKAANKAMEMAKPRGADDYFVKQLKTLLNRF